MDPIRLRMDPFRVIAVALADWIGGGGRRVVRQGFGQPTPADVVPVVYAEWYVDHPIRTPIAPLIELMLVVDGEIAMTVGHRRRVLRPGEMALVDAHRGNRGDHAGVRHACISFDIAGDARLRRLARAPVLLARRARDPVALRQRFREACARLAAPAGGVADAWRTAAMLALVAAAHDDAGATAADVDPRLDRALVAIETRIADPTLNLSDLARAAALSPDRLNALFRARFATTPMRRVLRLRLERARNLLARSDLSVKEVAAAVGFADPLHFSRAFRAAFGLAPTAHRAS